MRNSGNLTVLELSNDVIAGKMWNSRNSSEKTRNPRNLRIFELIVGVAEQIRNSGNLTVLELSNDVIAGQMRNSRNSSMLELINVRVSRALWNLMMKISERNNCIESSEGLHNLWNDGIVEGRPAPKPEVNWGSQISLLLDLEISEVNNVRIAEIKGIRRLEVEYINLILLSLPKWLNLNLKFFENLRVIKFSNVPVNVINLEILDALMVIRLINYRSLRKLRLPKKLQIFNIHEDLEDLETLTEITIENSPSVLPHVSTWKKLKYLEIYQSGCIEGLPVLSIKKCSRSMNAGGIDRFKSMELSSE